MFTRHCVRDTVKDALLAYRLLSAAVVDCWGEQAAQPRRMASGISRRSTSHDDLDMVGSKALPKPLFTRTPSSCLDPLGRLVLFSIIPTFRVSLGSGGLRRDSPGNSPRNPFQV